MTHVKFFRGWLATLCLVGAGAALQMAPGLPFSQAQIPTTPRALSSPSATPKNINQVVSPSPTLFRASEVRGIWLHTSAPLNWDAAMQKISKAGFNCVFVRAARGINSIYPSRYLARDPWSVASGDPLRHAVEAAHRYGLQCHAWVVCFNAGEASTSQGANVRAFAAQMRRADRMVRDNNGKQGPHLNPADPRNQALVTNVCREIVRNYAVDGLQLDYIRYPDSPTYNYDYGAVSRQRFEAFLGHSIAGWPTPVFRGPLKSQYEDWERNQITNLVHAVRGVAQSAPRRPGRSRVLLSAALWRQWRRNRLTVKQDWVNWVRAGLLDFAVPMNYKTDDAVFRQSVREEVAQVGGWVPLVAGIGNWQLSTPQLLRQIALARREGVDGYCLFAYSAANLNAQLAALKAGPQRQVSPFALAPRLSWTFSGGIPRTDQAQAFVVGQSAKVSSASLLEPNDAVTAHSVALQNVDTGALRAIADAGSDLPSWTFPMPYGRWRVVLRGVTSEKGVERPFVSHSPILEGVTPASAQRLGWHAS